MNDKDKLDITGNNDFEKDLELNQIIEEKTDLEKVDEIPQENLKSDQQQLEKIQNNDTKQVMDLDDEIKQQKLQEKKRKAKKTRKACYKFLATASCFAFLGAGIGAGSVISKNLLIKYEKDNFKFNVSEMPVYNEGVTLTSNSISNVFEEVGDSVVNISTLVTTRNPFSIFRQSSTGTASGSGIIYKVEGNDVYIITNNHVIEEASAVAISVTGKEQIPANLVGADASSDLAVISVSKNAMNQAGIKDITVAKFANSDEVKVGEFVFPIGNALGRGKIITQGIISAQNKQINIDGKSLTVLQTDAAINPGNSGGALINSKGEVVGVNTAKLSSSAIEGIGYAIPTNVAIKVAEEIIQNGSVQVPYFGIQGETITEDIKTIFNIKANGVLVVKVEDGSSADNAGIVSTDIITSFAGKEIKTLEDLSNALKQTKVGDTIDVSIIRNGYQEMQIEVNILPANSFSY